MLKIPTLFERVGNRVVNVLSSHVNQVDLSNAVPTEKLDGTNVRLTVRAGQIVRVEKRRNPSKAQKDFGIIEPWYTDAHEADPGDKWIWASIREVVDAQSKLMLPDGEWEAEAYGENIQGNPLQVQGHHLYWFSRRESTAILANDILPAFSWLQQWFMSARSLFNPDVAPEGIVWHERETWRPVAKIKARDFGWH